MSEVLYNACLLQHESRARGSQSNVSAQTITIPSVRDRPVNMLRSEFNVSICMPQIIPTQAFDYVASRSLRVVITRYLVPHGQEPLPSFCLRREIVRLAAVTEFGAAVAPHVVASFFFLYVGLAGWTFYDRSLRSALENMGLFDVQGGPGHVLLAGLAIVPRSTTRGAGVCSASEAGPLQPVFKDVVYMTVPAIGHGADHNI
jgi:hypothetical protein